MKTSLMISIRFENFFSYGWKYPVYMRSTLSRNTTIWIYSHGSPGRNTTTKAMISLLARNTTVK